MDVLSWEWYHAWDCSQAVHEWILLASPWTNLAAGNFWNNIKLRNLFRICFAAGDNSLIHYISILSWLYWLLSCSLIVPNRRRASRRRINDRHIFDWHCTSWTTMIMMMVTTPTCGLCCKANVNLCKIHNLSRFTFFIRMGSLMMNPVTGGSKKGLGHWNIEDNLKD